MLVRGSTYQFTIFGAFQEIAATPTIINELMGLFKEFRGGKDILVPVSVPNYDPKSDSKNMSLPILGLSFTNQSGSLHIQFNGSRIDIKETSNSLMTKKTFESELIDFNADVTFILKQLLDKYDKKISRIALILNLITKEVSDDKIDSIFKKIFTLNDDMMNNPRLEWNFRVNNRLTGKFQGEVLNSFLSFSRGNLNPHSTNRNTFLLQTEINTIPEKREERFNQEHIFEFYKTACQTQQEHISSFVKHIEL
ncbi:MAG TPA: hypothetical protein VNX01_07045 [Bacteroidia bacterium]|jgi:hypothetical protein|nr:hypothetical protein [Bacteroidia bacterium]